jgi:N-6 DNA Methylase/Eco57I restriction-modification methylase
MIAGVRGSLLSEDALARVIPDALRGLLGEAGRENVRRRLKAWYTAVRGQLGPAVASRTVFDRVAAPLLAELGYRVLPTGATPLALRALLEARHKPAATLLVTAWGQDPSTAWRDSVRQGIGHGVRWSFCVNGPTLRIVDSFRTYSRQFLEFDVDTAVDTEETFGVFWGLLRADAMVGSPSAASGERPLLDRAIAISDNHRAQVRTSLQHGVHDALVHLTRAFSKVRMRPSRRREPRTPNPEFDEALIVIYRILFLLFAEARGLVPRWHPVYRDGYTIESLRASVELLPRPRGLWETLQAIARLAHRGCTIGELRVPPFNGRLFSPADAPLSDRVPLDDGVVRQALLALTTRPARSGRERIAYGDLGVEQLGGVYERLLDFDPSSFSTPGTLDTTRTLGTPRAQVPGTNRKSTGAFYTPRALTEFLVRRTLAPLVHELPAAEILNVRVLDPAMGSGAFLVAACRYLASAYELALVREGGIGPGDITDRDRAEFRRTIAQRCLYGVDINPMAVRLGRLSLWLATLSAERPLTFLDHRLREGNSLVGAAPADLARQPPGGTRRNRTTALPLFNDLEHEQALRNAICVRSAIALEPGDTLAQVRAKERALAQLWRERSQTQWKDVCDLWCASWFWNRERARPRVPFGSLVDASFGRSALPDRITAPLVADARASAARERFFHWPFEFPEIFYESDGRSRPSPGFDAVFGNPPWEMLRGDRGDAPSRRLAHQAASQLTDFARSSGIYVLQGDGHTNMYQLFLERSLSLVRRGGRLGLILPSGLATDHGAARLRRALLDRMAVDSFISLENRDAVFPIHRSLKFLLLSGTSGGSTVALPCRFGLRTPEALDRLADLGSDDDSVALPRTLVERFAGHDLAIPDVRSPSDVELLSQIVFEIPALGDAAGWNVRFGRELNATENRRDFIAAPAPETLLPVIEGKQLTPFAVDLSSSRFRIAARVAARLLDRAQTFGRDRLAYRDVASATNRLTLIAAIVPAGTVTTHTLFCLKDPLDDAAQLFLCGMFNSFVANYLVRLRVSTHVTSGIIDRLPVPTPPRDSSAFTELTTIGAALRTDPSNRGQQAMLQARAAHLYGLDRRQFQRVLDTFPLVPRADRDAAMALFCDIVP